MDNNGLGIEIHHHRSLSLMWTKHANDFFALFFFGVEMWGFSVSGAVEENMGPPFLLARRRSYTKEDGAAKEI